MFQECHNFCAHCPVTFWWQSCECNCSLHALHAHTYALRSGSPSNVLHSTSTYVQLCISAAHWSGNPNGIHSSLPVYWWCLNAQIRDYHTEFRYSYPHLILNVKVGPCCQEVLNHLLVTLKACSVQWCLTILQRMCVSIVKVSEVSCHKVMNMSNMLREYNTPDYKACIPKQCATILYSVCVVQFLSHGSWHLSNYSTIYHYRWLSSIIYVVLTLWYRHRSKVWG